MESKIIRKIIFYSLITYPLFFFLIGYIFPHGENIFNKRALYFILLLGLLIIPFFILRFREGSRTQPESQQNNSKKVIVHGIFLVLTFIFSFLIGFSIPLMESSSKYNMAVIMVPLLIILILIILKQFQLNLTNFESKEQGLEIKEDVSAINPKRKPIIEFNGKQYSFTVRSLIIFAIRTPLLAYLTYFFFDLEFNFRLHEIVVKQTIYLLNFFFHMGVKA
ncbi:MAG: archaeosortase H N-terminal-like domain-containing protein, partial [Promethearchaeota archaeon]